MFKDPIEFVEKLPESAEAKRHSDAASKAKRVVEQLMDSPGKIGIYGKLPKHTADNEDEFNRSYNELRYIQYILDHYSGVTTDSRSFDDGTKVFWAGYNTPLYKRIFGGKK